MIFKKFFENKDEKTLKTVVIKGTDDTIKYLSLYILEKYRDKNIKKRSIQSKKNKGSENNYYNSNNGSLLPFLLFRRICCKLKNLD